MKTFKQFLEDINVSDDAYDADDSHSTTMMHDADVKLALASRKGRLAQKVNPESWNKLNLKVPFPIESMSVVWKKDRFDMSDTVVALLDQRDIASSDIKMPPGFPQPKLPKDKNRIAVSIKTLDKKFVTIGGALHALQTEVLSSRSEYKGGGLAPLLYETLIRNGQVLVSSDFQTGGGQSVWRRVIKSIGDSATVCVILDLEDAEQLLKAETARAPNSKVLAAMQYTSNIKFVLITGNLLRLDRLAYDDDLSARWCIIPHNAPDTSKIVDLALHI